MITVYVDVLFIINFSVDYIVLSLTGSIFHFRVKRWREILGALLMSIYALWALLICGSYVLLILSALAVIIFIVLFIYPIRGFRAFIKCMFTFFGLSFLFGGLIEILFRMMKHFMNSFTGERDGRQVIVFALLALVSTIFIWAGNKLLERGRDVQHIDAELVMLGKKYHASLFVDNGNMVCEPLSGRRVIFLTARYAEESGLMSYINNNEDFLKLKRIVCIDTANGKRALSAYLCDNISVTDKTVVGAVAIMPEEHCECHDGIFPSALL